jgi:nicotinamidase/pyrazinamidase
VHVYTLEDFLFKTTAWYHFRERERLRVRARKWVIQTMDKVLLIVDIQNDFLPGGALPVPRGEEVIAVINKVQKAFSCILATKDWHPSNHVSFASQHQKKPGDIIEVMGLKQELWPEHCIQGTYGAEFAPTLQTEKIERLFCKGIDPNIDSYSAFFDNAHLRSTGLEFYLRKSGVAEFYIAGLATDFCVKYSVLDAIELGFKVHVIEDGCRGIDLKPGDSKKAIETMQAVGADIIVSSQLMRFRT